MSLAISSALSGLQSASTRLADTARSIAGPTANNQATAAAPAPERPSGNARLASSSFPGDTQGNDLTNNLVDIKQAESLYKANAKVLSLLARTEESLLDILS